jgi:hypothetical protein
MSTELEDAVNEVGRVAFSAGYLKAFKDIMEHTQVANATIAHLINIGYNENRANEFVKAHTFRFPR